MITVTNRPTMLVIVASGEESTMLLKHAIVRALNTWHDAHPELKELHDKIVHGKVLQDYRIPSQGYPPKR
jgi:hypothetical protein